MWWAMRAAQGKAAARAADMELQARSDDNRAALLAQAQGARWRRNPDGTWMRWSYLGEDWEKGEPPQLLLQTVEMKPGENYWTATPNGGWMPYDPTKPIETQQVEETPQSEQLPEPQQPPRLDPSMVEQPQWTSDWKPGWKQEFKKP